MHLRSDGALPPSSTRTVEPKRESIPNKARKVLIGPASLLSMLKTIYQRADEMMKPAQLFAAMNTNHDPSSNTNTAHLNKQEREEIPPKMEEENIEDISAHFLCTYSTPPDWKQIVTTCDEYGQTFARIAVNLGYFRFLQHIFRWQIDLNVIDILGLSALYSAYLSQKEECAKMLIHSGVSRFTFNDLGHPPAGLDPPFEVVLRLIMDIDGHSIPDGAPPIERDTETPDEVGKPHAKHFFIQQWMKQSGDERTGEIPQSRCQSQEIDTHPALESTDESVRVITYDHSSSLGIHTPEGHSTPVVVEEIGWEALIETRTPPRIIHPPFPISHASPSPSTHITRTSSPQRAISKRAASTAIKDRVLASAWFKADGAGSKGCKLARKSEGLDAGIPFRWIRQNGVTISKCVGFVIDRWNWAVDYQRTEWGNRPCAYTDPGW